MFAFIRQKYHYSMEFDPNYPTINMSGFKGCKWKDRYGKSKEAIYPNPPEERGKEVDLCEYFDRYHTGEMKTSRSCSGFFYII